MRRASVGSASRRASVVPTSESLDPELPADWHKTLNNVVDPIFKADPELGEATREKLLLAARQIYMKEEEQHEAAMEQIRSKAQWQQKENEKKLQALRRAGTVQGDHLAVQLEASQQLVAKLQEELKTSVEALEQKVAEHVEHEKKLKWKLSMLDGGIAAAEAEREQYIALVGKKAIRRMKNTEMHHAFMVWLEQAHEERRMRVVVARFFSNKGLSRAWMAWTFMIESAARIQRLLGDATTRLTKPALTASLSFWKQDWEYVRQMAVQGGLLGRIAALEEELKQARAGATALAQVEAEAAHQRYIEQLGSRAVKRMLAEQLFQAWDTWREQWEEQAATRRRLANAVSVLARPALVASLAFWKQDWQTTAVTFLRRSSLRTESALYTRIATLQAEVKELQQDRANALEDLAEANRQRIDQMASRSIRRMLNSKMARAWEEWVGMWEERTRQMRMLGTFFKRLMSQQLSRSWATWIGRRDEGERMRRLLAAAGGRLRSPALSMGFQQWKSIWAGQSSITIEGLANQLKEARFSLSDALTLLEQKKEEITQKNEEIRRVRQEYEALRNDSADRLTHEATAKQMLTLQLEEMEQRLKDERARTMNAEHRADRLEARLNSKEAPMALKEKAALVAAMNARMKALAAEFANRSLPGPPGAPNLPRRTVSTPKLVAPVERDHVHGTLLELSASQQGAQAWKQHVVISDEIRTLLHR